MGFGRGDSDDGGRMMMGDSKMINLALLFADVNHFILVY
jgi:hypothetical protein